MGNIDPKMLSPKLKNALAQEVALDNLKVSLEDVDSFGNQKTMHDSIANVLRYNKMLAQKMTFVNDDLTSVVPFTRENLYLICAYTGSGKSTIAANISHPLWQQGKKILVLSNEESQQDVLFRIGCLHLGYNFNDYKKGKMDDQKQFDVMKLMPEIAKCVKVLDVVYKDGLTTKYEGIINALEAVKNQDYSCVLIDYYQLIQYSVKDPSKGRYDVLNDLRVYLGRYIKDSNIPVVLFVQLHSTGKRNMADIDGRIKECSAVIEPATVILEARPNYKDKTTEFLIHKDRFGFQGKKVVCGFDKGKYVRYDDDFKKRVAQENLKEFTSAVVMNMGDEEDDKK